jgi:tetratricopeptide (TPR) repeat protein
MNDGGPLRTRWNRTAAARLAALLVLCAAATASALEADLGPRLLEARRAWSKGDALGVEASRVASKGGDPIPLLDQQEAVYNTAEAAYVEALKSDPEHPYALADYGRLLVARHKLRTARRQLEAALASPRAEKAFAAVERADVLRMLAGLLERAGQTRRALTCYSEALKLNPADPRNRISLAVAQCAWNEPEEAAGILKPLTGPELALDGAPPAIRALAFYTLAYSLEECQQLNDAVAAYRRAVTLAEEAGNAETCGVAEQARLAIRRLSGAIRELQSEEVRQRHERAQVRCQEGCRLKKQALKDRRAFVLAREKYWEASGPQEQAQLRGQEPLQSLYAAIQSFQEALQIYSKCGRAHYELGLCYLTLLEQKAALPYFEAASAYDPANPGVLSALAETRMATGHEDEALDTFMQLLRLDAEYAPAQVGVARAALKLLRSPQDLDLARDSLDRALFLGADATQLTQLMERLDELDKGVRSGKPLPSGARPKAARPSRHEPEPFDPLKGTILE